MGFDARRPAAQASAAQLATASSAGMEARVSVEPDLSKIRPRVAVEESPEQRKKRVAAKTLNFGATIIARIIILAAGALYLWDAYEFSGQVSRGLAMGMVLMVADLGRVTLKAMEPGSK